MPVFLPVPGFVGHYDVSEDGVVRSLRCRPRGLDRPRSRPRAMKQVKDQGYWKVTLSVPGKRSSERGGRMQTTVHRLVALAHLDPFPDPSHVVAHLDGDRNNNHVSNLAFMPQRDNCRMKWEHGTMVLGDDHHGSVPLETCRAAVSGIAGGRAYGDLAQELGISLRSLRRIQRGETFNAREAIREAWVQSEDPWTEVYGVFF